MPCAPPVACWSSKRIRARQADVDNYYTAYRQGWFGLMRTLVTSRNGTRSWTAARCRSTTSRASRPGGTGPWVSRTPRRAKCPRRRRNRAPWNAALKTILGPCLTMMCPAPCAWRKRNSRPHCVGRAQPRESHWRCSSRPAAWNVRFDTLSRPGLSAPGAGSGRPEGHCGR